MIRPARDDDREGIWRIPAPMIRTGRTYSLSREVSREKTLGLGPRPYLEFARPLIGCLEETPETLTLDRQASPASFVFDCQNRSEKADKSDVTCYC